MEPEDTDPVADEPRERRPPIVLGRAHAAAAAVVAAVVDGLLVARANADVATKAFSIIFMGVFTYVGFRFITKVRYTLRPPQLPLPDRDSSDRPAPGGWANPTKGQTLLAKLIKPFKKMR